jgi:hypothetical protein
VAGPVGTRPCACSGDVFAKERKDVFGLRVASEHRFREEQFSVEVNVEDSARAGNDLDTIDLFLPLLEDARDQTGRVRQRASGNAVLDPDTMSRGHRSIVVPGLLVHGGMVLLVAYALRAASRGAHHSLTTG